MEEKYRKNVYCEWKFIEQYLERIEELSKRGENQPLNEDNTQVLSFYFYLKHLLLSADVKLFLDLDPTYFLTKQKELDKKRLNALKKGKNITLDKYEQIFLELGISQMKSEGHIKCQGDQFIHIAQLEQLEELDQAHLDAIYLCSEPSEVCERLMQKWGVLVISPENAETLVPFLSDNGVAVRKNEQGTWFKTLENRIPYCSALVLVDNYVLNDMPVIYQDVQDIFEAILPQELSDGLDFHLTFITALKNNDHKILPIQPRYETLKEILKEVRPNLKVKLSIVKCDPYLFHDRTLITNNLWVGSGGGFDLYKNFKSTKTTTINIVSPFINNSIMWSHDAYSNLLLTARKVWKQIMQKNERGEYQYEYQNDSFPLFIYGDKENRLLEEE